MQTTIEDLRIENCGKSSDSMKTSLADVKE
jgi:hypothetical protein